MAGDLGGREDEEERGEDGETAGNPGAEKAGAAAAEGDDEASRRHSVYRQQGLALLPPDHISLISRPSSQSLPAARELSSQLPAGLFGEAVMLLEFLHSFGPLFNIREVIREGITFGELAVVI